MLVVYKKSAYQLYLIDRRDSRLRQLLRRRCPALLDMRDAHEVHQRTLEAVERSLHRLGASYDLVYRADITRPSRYGLVVCVGGDGTLLQVSHAVRDTPILGVNSDPDRSEAVFSAATRHTCGRLLGLALARRLPELALARLRVTHNGRRLPTLVLNDILVAHGNPATMTRYELIIGTRREFQKSSGLWVATAAGSSSAVLAAGGRRLPWGAARFQYRPRELYSGRLARPRLTGGVLGRRQRVGLTWLMREGAIFVDGPHLRYPLRFGDRVTIELSPVHPLRLLGMTPSGRRVR